MSSGREVRLLLSAGRGPQECAWAVAELTDRLEAEAAPRAISVRRLESTPDDRVGTYRSVLPELAGDGAAAFAASWAGTLCWQAPSPYRPSTSRKNWYVISQILAAIPEPAPFNKTDVDVVALRTGGPGGQHRNKVSTAVRATHRPTGLVVVVDSERHQQANRRRALELLGHKLGQQGAAAQRAADVEEWRTHDQLVRGNPTRVERPAPATRRDPPPRRSRAQRP